MDELEVFFCDLCGTSVPAIDLERAEALRMHGKIVGVCCRQQVLAPRIAGGSGRFGQMAGILVVLVAVAGAAIFLDWRLSDEAQRSERGIDRLALRLGLQDERLLGMEARLLQTASRGDWQSIDDRTDALRRAMLSLDQRITSSMGASDSGQRDLMRELGQLRRSLDLQSARINQLQEQSRRISADLADLISLPRAAVPASVANDSTLPRHALGERQPSLPATIARLLPMLSDSDAGTRFEAVDELLQSGDGRIFMHIIPLATDPDPFVRRLVVEGLAGHRAAPAVDVLLLALGDPESLVRYTAVASLRKLTGQRIPFDAEASSDQRASMLRRWQQWWTKNKVEFF